MQSKMIDLLRTRRSVRKFTEQSGESEKLELLKEAVLHSPSSKNPNACEYLFIDDPTKIEKLAQCKPSGASAPLTAQLEVVVLANESQTVA